jgi:hypothetical protein
VFVLGRFTQRNMSKDKGANAEMGPMCPGERVRVQLWGEYISLEGWGSMGTSVCRAGWWVGPCPGHMKWPGA